MTPDDGVSTNAEQDTKPLGVLQMAQYNLSLLGDRIILKSLATVQDPKDYVIMAENPNEHEDWLKALESVLEKLHPKTQNRQRPSASVAPAPSPTVAQDVRTRAETALPSSGTGAVRAAPAGNEAQPTSTTESSSEPVKEAPPASTVTNTAVSPSVKVINSEEPPPASVQKIPETTTTSNAAASTSPLRVRLTTQSSGTSNSPVGSPGMHSSPSANRLSTRHSVRLPAIAAIETDENATSSNAANNAYVSSSSASPVAHVQQNMAGRRPSLSNLLAPVPKAFSGAIDMPLLDAAEIEKQLAALHDDLKFIYDAVAWREAPHFEFENLRSSDTGIAAPPNTITPEAQETSPVPTTQSEPAVTEPAQDTSSVPPVKEEPHTTEHHEPPTTAAEPVSTTDTSTSEAPQTAEPQVSAPVQDAVPPQEEQQSATQAHEEPKTEPQQQTSEPAPTEAPSSQEAPAVNAAPESAPAASTETQQPAPATSEPEPVTTTTPSDPEPTEPPTEPKTEPSEPEAPRVAAEPHPMEASFTFYEPPLSPTHSGNTTDNIDAPDAILATVPHADEPIVPSAIKVVEPEAQAAPAPQEPVPQGEPMQLVPVTSLPEEGIQESLTSSTSGTGDVASSSPPDSHDQAPLSSSPSRSPEDKRTQLEPISTTVDESSPSLPHIPGPSDPYQHPRLSARYQHPGHASQVFLPPSEVDREAILDDIIDGIDVATSAALPSPPRGSAMDTLEDAETTAELLAALMDPSFGSPSNNTISPLEAAFLTSEIDKLTSSMDEPRDSLASDFAETSFSSPFDEAPMATSSSEASSSNAASSSSPIAIAGKPNNGDDAEEGTISSSFGAGFRRPTKDRRAGMTLSAHHRAATPDIHQLEKAEAESRLRRLRERLISPEDPIGVYDCSERSIGKGGMGEVFFATRKGSSRKVAIKKLQTFWKGKDRLPTILNEINVMAHSKHPNIINYIASYQVDQELWVCMEYMDKGSLYDLVRLNIKLEEKHLAYIIKQIVYALTFIHDLKRVHRDIKVDNVLLSSRGEIKLADFGAAVQLTFQRLKRTTMTGTPYYMSPEVISGKQYDELVDVWSLGILCIELAERAPPYYDLPPDQALDRIVKDGVKGLPTRRYSNDFIDFVNNKCLQFDASKRWTSSQLQTHPFLKKAVTQQEFASYLHSLDGMAQVDSGCTIL